MRKPRACRDERLFKLLAETREADFLFGAEIKDYIEDVYLSLLKTRSERKLEQARERKSFGCDHAEAAAIEIAHGFHTELDGTTFDQEMRGRCRNRRCGGNQR